MKQMKREYKRKTVYIKKGFQFRFILKFCLILLAGVLLSTTLLVLSTRGTLTSTFENSRLVIENTGAAMFPAILMTNLITLGIICVAVILVTLYVSHRIAGPMFRFEQDLQRIKAGDLCVNIHLRKKDQFAEMAGYLNEMTRSLHDKVVTLQDRLDALPECEKCDKQVDELKAVISKEFIL